MATLPLHYLGSPVLRQHGDTVDVVDDTVRQFVDDLFETMRANQGVGLAANQVGVARQIAVVDTQEAPPIVLINPIVTSRSGKARAEEGCLSIPEIFGDVDRATHIVVETTALDGTRISVEATDLTARAVQHEIDHLEGILFLDRLSPLKRRLLTRKWKKSRDGKEGFIQGTPTPQSST